MTAALCGALAGMIFAQLGWFLVGPAYGAIRSIVLMMAQMGIAAVVFVGVAMIRNFVVGRLG